MAMASMLRVVDELSPLRDPVLIAAFAGANGGGSAAATMQYLCEQWRARPVAEIDPDECFDFTVRRPIVRFVDGVRTVEWPVNRIYVASPPGAARDVVLLPGIEPHMQWRHFGAALIECLRALGCSSAVLLGSEAGPVPHTRPLPLRLTTTDDAMGQAFALEPAEESAEGPIDFATALGEQLKAEGTGLTMLTVLTPFYIPTEPNARAMLTLSHALDGAFGTSTLTSRLDEAAAVLDEEASAAVEDSPALRVGVQSLERQFDWIRGASMPKRGAPGATAPLPTHAEVLDQVEHMLRDQRRPGGGLAPAS
jgi:hypothetical protein